MAGDSAEQERMGIVRAFRSARTRRRLHQRRASLRHTNIYRKYALLYSFANKRRSGILVALLFVF